MKSKVFKVTVAGISEDNFQNEYVIDGVRAPRLELPLGYEYIFDLDVEGYPFYITTDAIGGSKKLKGVILNDNNTNVTKAIESGKLHFTPTSEHKDMKLYYQCDSTRLMGGRIIIK